MTNKKRPNSSNPYPTKMVSNIMKSTSIAQVNVHHAKGTSFVVLGMFAQPTLRMVLIQELP